MTNAALSTLLGLLVATAPLPAGAADSTRSWHFRVYLDGKPIGTHDFKIDRHGNETVVDSAATFDVRIGFVPVYRYTHHDHEVWRDDCIVLLWSRTDDNGHQEFVTGSLRHDGFATESPAGRRILPACTRTFAYWDPALLRAPRLLNSQTGAYPVVELTSGGSTPDGTGNALEHYALRGDALSIDLWYSPAGDWVALQSRLENGRTLRYELQ